MGINVNKAKEEKEAVDREWGQGSVKFLQLKEGPNQIRLIPPFGAREEAWVKFKKSFKVGPNKNSVAPKWDSTCRLKKAHDELLQRGDEASKKEADAMYPKNRVGYWVIDRAAEQEGPQFFDTNVNVHRDVLGIISDPDYGDISDPVSGVDLTINYVPKEKTKNGFPDWAVLPKRAATPLGTPEQIAEWTAEDLFIKYGIGKPSEDGFIEAALNGTVEEYLKSGGAEAGDTSFNPNELSQGTAVANQEQAPPPAQTTVATQAVRTAKVANPGLKVWVSGADGAVKLVTCQEVADLLMAGQAPPVMAENQAGGWQTAAAFGVVIEEYTPAPPAPAPAAPAPPSAPPPPAAPAAPTPPGAPVGAPPSAPFQSSEEEALEKQLAALKAARANGTSSQVSQDLKSKLGG